MVNWFSVECLRQFNGEKEETFKKMVLRQMDINIEKNEAGSLPHTVYKN